MGQKLKSERLVVFDLETTGLDPLRDQVLQIGAVALDSELRIVEELEAKVRFEGKVSREVSELNRSGEERWKREAKSPRVVAKDFASFLKRHTSIEKVTNSGKAYFVAELASYNASFDEPFLAAFFERAGVFLPAARRVVCLLDRVRWFILEEGRKRPPESMRLSSVAEYFNVEVPGNAHDALVDATTAALVYQELRRRSSKAEPFKGRSGWAKARGKEARAQGTEPSCPEALRFSIVR